MYHVKSTRTLLIARLYKPNSYIARTFAVLPDIGNRPGIDDLAIKFRYMRKPMFRPAVRWKPAVPKFRTPKTIPSTEQRRTTKGVSAQNAPFQEKKNEKTYMLPEAQSTKPLKGITPAYARAYAQSLLACDLLKTCGRAKAVHALKTKPTPSQFSPVALHLSA